MNASRNLASYILLAETSATEIKRQVENGEWNRTDGEDLGYRYQIDGADVVEYAVDGDKLIEVDREPLPELTADEARYTESETWTWGSTILAIRGGTDEEVEDEIRQGFPGQTGTAHSSAGRSIEIA
jgi:hypothetical protein